MIYTKSFPGWESFGALVSHLKFVADHHQKIERIAARQRIPKYRASPITSFRRRLSTLASKNKDQALAWLETGR
jgi:hypothetical protein